MFFLLFRIWAERSCSHPLLPALQPPHALSCAVLPCLCCADRSSRRSRAARRASRPWFTSSSSSSSSSSSLLHGALLWWTLSTKRKENHPRGLVRCTPGLMWQVLAASITYVSSRGTHVTKWVAYRVTKSGNKLTTPLSPTHDAPRTTFR